MEREKKIMRALFMVISFSLLAGCMQSTPRYWQHKTIPSSQWGADYNKCKRSVDRYLGLNPRYQADQGLDKYSESMRVYEVGKKQKEMVADCMRRAGYVPMK